MIATRTADWQLSATRFGEVVDGADAFAQTIGLILGTRLGSDPFRPSFGSDLYEYIDRPINAAAPAMALEIRRALNRWAEGVTVTGVSYTFQDSFGGDGIPSGIRFAVSWVPTGTTDPNELNLLITTVAGEAPAAALIVAFATETGQPITTETGWLLTFI